MHRSLELIYGTTRPLVMGVLNVTPDSFADEDRVGDDPQKALAKARQLLADGADMIDIGGVSFHPRATFVSLEEELHRVMPVIHLIRAELGSGPILSIDTRREAVVEAALKGPKQGGVDLINLNGGLAHQQGVAYLAAQTGCALVSYHVDDVRPYSVETALSRIDDFFLQELETGFQCGMSPQQFVFDPGVGIGKSFRQTHAIIEQFARFAKLGPETQPLLLGAARKEHLGRLLRRELGLSEVPGPLERMEAGLAEATVAVQNGARIIRTHDVRITRRFFATLDTFKPQQV